MLPRRSQSTLSQYEQQRDVTIRVNEQKLKALGLLPDDKDEPKIKRRREPRPPPEPDALRRTDREMTAVASYRDVESSPKRRRRRPPPPPQPTQLRALSIKQPFASGILAGVKVVENRTWGGPGARPLPLPKDGSGLWMALHSSASPEQSGHHLVQRLRDACSRRP